MLTIRVDSYHFGNGKTVGPLTQPERGEVNEPKMELIGIQKQEINRLAKSGGEILLLLQKSAVNICQPPKDTRQLDSKFLSGKIDQPIVRTTTNWRFLV